MFCTYENTHSSGTPKVQVSRETPPSPLTNPHWPNLSLTRPPTASIRLAPYSSFRPCMLWRPTWRFDFWDFSFLRFAFRHTPTALASCRPGPIKQKGLDANSLHPLDPSARLASLFIWCHPKSTSRRSFFPFLYSQDRSALCILSRLPCNKNLPIPIRTDSILRLQSCRPEQSPYSVTTASFPPYQSTQGDPV